MTREEARKRLEVYLICAQCPEDKECYDSYLHSTCEYNDCREEVSLAEAIRTAIKALGQEPKTGQWTIKQYQVPIENKQIPTISGTALTREPTACKIVCTYTHSVCKSKEYLNKYKFCPNCGCRMVDPQESEESK